MTETIRAVVDTNVWMNAVEQRVGQDVDDLLVFRALVMGYFVSVVTKQMIREMWTVMGSRGELRVMVLAIVKLSEDVSDSELRIRPATAVVRDMEDMKFLDAALRGGAGWIVTNDQGFLRDDVLSKLAGLGILVRSPAGFIEELI